MRDKTIPLLLAVFPIAWGLAMMVYMRKRPEKLRMSYVQFRVLCLFAIGGGVVLACFVAFYH